VELNQPYGTSNPKKIEMHSHLAQTNPYGTPNPKKIEMYPLA